ncbi:hypothetical protein CPC16_001179 [Podila verticillata]|nr:hypothetical protein CPC16_001179 [Podila verticillata]
MHRLLDQAFSLSVIEGFDKHPSTKIAKEYVDCLVKHGFVGVFYQVRPMRYTAIAGKTTSDLASLETQAPIVQLAKDLYDVEHEKANFTRAILRNRVSTPPPVQRSRDTNNGERQVEEENERQGDKRQDEDERDEEGYECKDLEIHSSQIRLESGAAFDIVAGYIKKQLPDVPGVGIAQSLLNKNRVVWKAVFSKTVVET